MRADLLAAPTARIGKLLESAEERMAETERAERLLSVREGKLAQAERTLEEERAALEADLADSVADATVLVRQRLEDETQRRRRLERELQDRQHQDAALEELQRLTGGSPQSAVTRLHDLQARLRELQLELSERPETDVVAKLEIESAERSRLTGVVASLQDEIENRRDRGLDRSACRARTRPPSAHSRCDECRDRCLHGGDRTSHPKLRGIEFHRRFRRPVPRVPGDGHQHGAPTPAIDIAR